MTLRLEVLRIEMIPDLVLSERVDFHVDKHEVPVFEVLALMRLTSCFDCKIAEANGIFPYLIGAV